MLENQHALIVVSEYSGLAAISLVPKDQYDDLQRHTLATNWTRRVSGKWSRYVRLCYGTNALTRQGTMSNGESVYRRAV